MDKIKFSKGLFLINSLVLLVCMILMLSCKTNNSGPTPAPDPEPIIMTSTTLLGFGDNYTVLHSADNGKIWTLSTLPEDVTNKRFKNRLNNAVYTGEDKGWFAVGGFSSGAIQEAVMVQSVDDGLTWTSVANPSTSELRDIAYSNGKFVAVGAKNNIVLSDDGITWTKIDLDGVLSIQSGTPDFRHVIIKGDIIVASGRISFSPSSSTYLVVESTDNGETWSDIRTLGGDIVTHAQVVGDDILLILKGRVATRKGDNWVYDNRSGRDGVESPLMVAKDGLYGMSSNLQGVRYVLKREGDNWIRSGTERFTNLGVNAMIAGDGKYIFIGSERPSLASNPPFAAIYVSEDCAVWTDGRASLGDELKGSNWHGFKSGVFSNGEFIIAGDQDRIPGTPTVIFTSTDGVNWVKSVVPSSLTKDQQIHKIIKR